MSIVPVNPDDTVRSLANRVFAEECVAYPEAIALYARGKLAHVGGKVSIQEEKD